MLIELNTSELGVFGSTGEITITSEFGKIITINENDMDISIDEMVTGKTATVACEGVEVSAKL